MQVADGHRMNVSRALLFLALLVADVASAQQSTAWRKEYEKEKNGPHGECTTSWNTLRPGLEYRAIRCLGSRDDLDLHVVRIDPSHWKIDTAIFDGGALAHEAARDEGAAFVLNANFFDESRKPLGVVMRAGKQATRPRTSSWQSIFYLDRAGTPRIVLPEDFAASRAWSAVQAGPRLVVGGHTARVKQSYSAARAGVCIQKDGDLTFFATPQDRKFDMYEIARIARRGEADGGLECRDAMLFDGGHSVNFRVDGATRVSVEGDRVPVYVVATAR